MRFLVGMIIGALLAIPFAPGWEFREDLIRQTKLFIKDKRVALFVEKEIVKKELVQKEQAPFVQLREPTRNVGDESVRSPQNRHIRTDTSNIVQNYEQSRRIKEDSVAAITWNTEPAKVVATQPDQFRPSLDKSVTSLIDMRRQAETSDVTGKPEPAGAVKEDPTERGSELVAARPARNDVKPSSKHTSTKKTSTLFQAAWSPFHSESTARGFASQLTKHLDREFRVIKVKAGHYEVGFSFSNQSDRLRMLDEISAITGFASNAPPRSGFL